MKKEEKTKLISDLKEEFNASGLVVAAHYSGLTVGEITALRNAIGRQVQINILLELSSGHGGKVSNHDSVKAMRKALPSINIYAWASHKNGTGTYGATGSVHAKCAVADEEFAFITSANLTAAAMERNMELGVLVKGGNLPIELHQHLEALVATKIIEQI